VVFPHRAKEADRGHSLLEQIERDRAEAVTRAARAYLRTCRSRELASMSRNLDYDENAWRELDNPN